MALKVSGFCAALATAALFAASLCAASARPLVPAERRYEPFDSRDARLRRRGAAERNHRALSRARERILAHGPRNRRLRGRARDRLPLERPRLYSAALLPGLRSDERRQDARRLLFDLQDYRAASAISSGLNGASRASTASTPTRRIARWRGPDESSDASRRALTVSLPRLPLAVCAALAWSYRSSRAPRAQDAGCVLDNCADKAAPGARISRAR